MLLIAATAAAAAAANCPTEKCGNVSIPYPFGIARGCFREGFNISCKQDKKGNPKPYIFNNEIISISIATAQMQVHNPIGYACYGTSGRLSAGHSLNASLDLSGTPYRLSDTRNKFTAIGCQTLAYIMDYTGRAKDQYKSGCLSVCREEDSVRDGEPCNGFGCCQTAIPKRLSHYRVAFSGGFNHSRVANFSPCSYAFLADENWYKFNSSDVKFDEFHKRNNGVTPVVLDWAIRDQVCQQAKQNETYACRSGNSNCTDSANGQGYTCSCSSGYQGNPYIPDGCEDIDECEDQKQYKCYGECRNSDGSFDCYCPSGTHGDPNTRGGCQPEISLLVKILIGKLLFITKFYSAKKSHLLLLFSYRELTILLKQRYHYHKESETYVF